MRTKKKTSTKKVLATDNEPKTLIYNRDTKEMEVLIPNPKPEPHILFNDTIDGVKVFVFEQVAEIGSSFYIDLENPDSELSIKVNKTHLERDQYRQDLLSLPVLEKYAKQCNEELIRSAKREILDSYLDVDKIRKAYRFIVKDQEAWMNVRFMKRAILDFKFTD